MDKRLIASIKNNIEKLDKKLAAMQAEAFDIKNRREKFQEMLELVGPKSELPLQPAHGEQATQEPSKAAVPTFLKGEKQGHPASATHGV